MAFSPFSIIETIFPIFFLVILGIVIFNIVNGAKQWNHNNQQPVLKVKAKVVAKRTSVSRQHHHHNEHVHHSTSTTYYTTFEVESGDRMELQLSGKEYGLIAEGDVGNLTFQGTRFQNFERVGFHK